MPGWACEDLVKKLSFYRHDLPINDVLFSDWQYDTLHYRLVDNRDELGNEIHGPGVESEPTFIDDVLAAMETSCTQARLV